jgi:hypothetical protein
MLPAAVAAPVFNLTEDDLAALSPQARERYEVAVRLFERQEYAPGFRTLSEAADAASGESVASAKLQLVLGQVATNLAETQSPNLAPRFLEVARTAFSRAASNEAASVSLRADAQEKLAALDDVQAGIEREAEAGRERQALLERGREALDQASQAESAAQAARAAEDQRNAPTQAPDVGGQPPAQRPGDPPRYTGANRSMMAIQQARDLRNSSTETNY